MADPHVSETENPAAAGAYTPAAAGILFCFFCLFFGVLFFEGGNCFV